MDSVTIVVLMLKWNICKYHKIPDKYELQINIDQDSRIRLSVWSVTQPTKL